MMIKILFYSLFSVLFFFNNSFAQKISTDPFKSILNRFELSKDNLGFKPKDYWNRFPKEIPYKFLAFDNLFAEPLQLYNYTKLMGNITEKFLSPEYISSNYDFLHNITFKLAVDRFIGGFRGYGANISDTPSNHKTLFSAITDLQSTVDSDFVSNSYKEFSDFKTNSQKLTKQISAIPINLQNEIAILIYNLTDAYKWREIAIRNLNIKDMEKVYSNRDFPFTQSDGVVYYPEFDDVRSSIDQQSLYYSALKIVSASDLFRYRVDSLLNVNKYQLGNLNIKIETYLGYIFISGTGENKYNESNNFLIIDFGGNDIYTGSVAATSSLDNPISVLVDFAGDDIYNNDVEDIISQGAGIFGTGLLIDIRGNDIYKSKSYSQGLGIFGLGLICDIEGNDNYKIEFSGQGCGYFGIGMHLDSTGDDSLYLYVDGQGLGGVAGIGILANYSGDDTYAAEWNPEIFDMGDYHSKKEVNENRAQGAGFGRRGDVSDGHAWAGGQGAIIDIAGNDKYLSGNFSQGIGYWFGLGMMYEGDGNDIYKSVYFTQASAAHFAMGVIIDEGGNDSHILEKTGGAGLSFGWDWTNSFFVDKEGDDYYEANKISIGTAMRRSNSFFFELGGNDTYKMKHIKRFLGSAVYHKSFKQPLQTYTYFFEGTQSAFFLDLDGNDSYYTWNKDEQSYFKSDVYKNDSEWLQPLYEDAIKNKNYGMGIDMNGGKLNLFNKWELKIKK